MRALLLLLLLALLPRPALAQEGAALVADSLLLTADGRLVAEGNVQAFYEGSTLSAERVTYDPGTERLLIDGPILLRDAEGNILTAERADLDPRLEQGLLAGARLVLDRQLQIAATRLERTEGLTTLTGAAATACQVCPGRAPLWEIRAARVVRDERARTLTFEDAQFLVRGTPILWLPRIRLPEPGNPRASGLLLPRLRGSGELGLGAELPVFLELGPSRDLTLTPFLSPMTATLGARYREAYLNGEIEVGGAVSLDRLGPEGPRGYLSAEGAFALGGGWDLAFEGVAATDGDYLSDYGIAEGEVLESTVAAARVEADSLALGRLSGFQDLRDGGTGEVPDALAELSWERRSPLGAGTLTWGASLDGVLRRDGAILRDTLRAGGFAGWRGDAVVGPGVVVEGDARLALDAWAVADDPEFPETVLRALPEAAVRLRWPLVRRGAGGVSDLVEPVAMLGWSEALGGTPPLEDAGLAELDEANLLALSRLPGENAADEGLRGAVGVLWTRTAPGFESELTFGRVFGAEEAAWLAGGRLGLPGGLGLEGRAAFEEDGAVARADARIDWEAETVSLEAGYAFVGGGARAFAGEEVAFAAELRPSERWAVRGDARYDLGEGEPRRLGLGVRWRNECVEVDVSVARSYTRDDDGEPSTEFGLSVGLLGFSTSGEARVAPGACRG